MSLKNLYNIFLFYINKARLWKVKESGLINKASGSSILDSEGNSDYLKSIKLINQNPSYFSKFRKSKSIYVAIEGLKPNFAQTYENLIETIGWKNGYTNLIKEFDSVGKPDKYKFRNGKFSTISLRYLKVHLDLISEFGNLDQFKVAEIGAGYGGQSFFIIKQNRIKSYKIFDLPEVNQTISMFLSQFELPIKCEFGESPSKTENFDLVISNYAFSELNRNVQKLYLENVLQKSTRGYMTWNDLSFKKLGGYSLAELLDLLPGSRYKDEYPLTAIGNVIITWNNN